MSTYFKHRPYGAAAAQFILDRDRANLWAPPGFGKTSMVLSVIEALEFAGSSEPTLVLAPKRVAADTWANEARKWDQFKHINVQPILGDLKTRRRALRTDAPVHTINYENVGWLMEELNGRWPWKHVIADEATKLKGFRLREGTKRARALAPVAHKKVSRWVNLTGTPSSNGLKDLWGQQWFIDGGARLGASYTAFSDRWFRKGYDGYGMEPMPHAQDQIIAALADCTMSLRVEDWFDTAAPVERTHNIELPRAARALYKELETELFVKLSETANITAVNAAVLSNKLLQCCSGAAYVGADREAWHTLHDEKLDVLESIVDECGGEAVMVAYQFKFDKERIITRFGKSAAVDLATPEGFQRFMTGDALIGVAHPASMGHGVDGLQRRCRTLVYYSQDWNLENYLQIKERIGPVRQKQAGFDRAVMVHHIVAERTVEELVMARRQSKRDVQDLLMDYFKFTAGMAA